MYIFTCTLLSSPFVKLEVFTITTSFSVMFLNSSACLLSSLRLEDKGFICAIIFYISLP